MHRKHEIQSSLGPFFTLSEQQELAKGQLAGAPKHRGLSQVTEYFLTHCVRPVPGAYPVEFTVQHARKEWVLNHHPTQASTAI